MNTKLIAGLVIIFLMVFSIFGFVLDYAFQQEKYQYNDYEFTVTPQGYKTEINDQDYYFQVLPTEVDYIELNTIDSKVYTVSYNPNSTNAMDLAAIQYYVEQQLRNTHIITRAATDNSTTLPVQTCTDATQSQPVILLNVTDSTSTTVENNCIIINGIDGYDVLRQTERILYHITGIIP